MGILEIIGLKRKELTLEQVKREEIKLGIREGQTLSKLEKLEKEREDIFSKGMKIKSPPRRRHARFTRTNLRVIASFTTTE